MDSLFDVVIPVGPNDVDQLAHQLQYTKTNVIGYRHIYLVSYDDSLRVEDCITISEEIFPFSVETVKEYGVHKKRYGWYLQQLLKLYAGIVIPGILDRYLVIDADTYFLKPTVFVEDDKCLYNYGREYYRPYFVHMQKLHPLLTKVDRQMSGICHHMVFETRYIKSLFELVEGEHNNEQFYDIFLKNVLSDQTSGASEYEIYFNYILGLGCDKIKIRRLRWANVHSIAANLDKGFDYISYHWAMRGQCRANCACRARLH